MHHHRHRGEHGRGRPFFHRPFPNRQELLERLQNYQRDLEQELVDIEDVIRHLRGNDTPPAAPAEPAQG